MHYERNLIQQQIAQEQQINVQSVTQPAMGSYPIPSNIPIRPVVPSMMAGYPFNYPVMYRGHFPPGMIYPQMNPNSNVSQDTEEAKK